MTSQLLDKFYIKMDTIENQNSQPEFNNHKLLCSFRVADAKSLKPTESIKIRYINDEDMIQSLKKKSLANKRGHYLIRDHQMYRNEKLKVFHQLIKSKNLAQKTDPKPTFVTEDTTIIDLMAAPQMFNGEFEFKDSFNILAQRGPDGLIYMRSTDARDILKRHSLNDFNSHIRLEILKLLKYADLYMPVKISEYQKSFDVIEEEFGQNRLIVLKEVQAYDSNNIPVKIGLNFGQNVFDKYYNYEKKMFPLWCHSKISGPNNKAIIAWVKRKDCGPVLKSIQVVNFDHDDLIYDLIRNKTGRESFGRDDDPVPWKKNDSYGFLNRFLDFVADYVSRPSNNGQVFSFRFKKEWLFNHNNYCFIAPEKSEITCIYD